MTSFGSVRMKSPTLIHGYNQQRLKGAYYLDKLFHVVFKLFVDNKKRFPLSFNLPKILIVQSHLIGDVVMVTPMLRALRHAYPDSEIVLLANRFAKDLLKGLPYINRVVTLKFPWSMYDYSLKNLINMLSTIKKLRKEKFDLVIDAQIDMRNTFLMYLISAKKRLGYDITGGGVFLTDVPEFPVEAVNLLEARLSLLNYLGIDTSDKRTELAIGEESIVWVDSYIKLNNFDKNKIVGIHPGASTKEKRWRSERFARVIDHLAERGYCPVVIEGPDDGKIVGSILSQGKTQPSTLKTSLKNVATFMSRCRLIICLDSAAIHIAGAVNTPAVALYGPRWPEMTKPFNDNIEIIWDESFNCRPCEYGYCKNIGHSCMDAISAETVIRKIDKVLGC